jgi:hypothetical protein
MRLHITASTLWVPAVASSLPVREVKTHVFVGEVKRFPRERRKP